MLPALIWSLLFGKREPPHPLDRPILDWTPRDILSMRGLLNGGVLILGRPGSGKTSSFARILALAIIKSMGSGGLILASAPSDLAMWRELFRLAGREEYLVPFGPGHPHRFNFVQFLLKLNLDIRDIAKTIILIGEALDNDDSRSGGGEGDKFWTVQTKVYFESALVVIKHGEGELSIPLIQRFLSTAASCPEELEDEGWRASFHAQCMRRAEKCPKTPAEERDFLLARSEWLRRWPAMNSRTRSSLEANMAGILAVFCSGIVHELLSTTTTISPAAMEQGAWLFVDASVGQYGSSGAFILNALRLATQKMVLKRHPDRWTNPICVWADEAGKIINSADSFFLSEARKFGGFSVFLAQSVASFYAALPGERGRHQADNLMGCFSHKLIHACDPVTAEWASKSIGDTREVFISTTDPGNQEPFDMWSGDATVSVSVSSQYCPALKTSTLMNGMRTGGPPGYTCDSVVIRSGQEFAHGENWLWRPWSQK